MRTAFAALVVLMLLGVPFAGPAGAAPGVESLHLPVQSGGRDGARFTRADRCAERQRRHGDSDRCRGRRADSSGRERHRPLRQLLDGCRYRHLLVRVAPGGRRDPRSERLPDVRSDPRGRGHLERGRRPGGYRRQQQRPARRRRGTRERRPSRSVRVHPCRGRDRDDFLCPAPVREPGSDRGRQREGVGHCHGRSHDRSRIVRLLPRSTS